MRVSPPLVLVVLGLVCSSPVVSASSGDLLSAYGTATVDGVLSPGEYGSCIGPISQEGYLFKICETNDDASNYYAVMIDDPTNDHDDVAAFYFDDDNDGVVVSCGAGNVPPPEEDLIVAFGPGSPPQPGPDGNYCYNTVAGDLYGANGEATLNGGDVVKFTPSAGYVYEWWHPLNSGDSQDYGLSPGSTVRWCFTYLDQGTSPTTHLQFPVGCYDAARSGDASKYGLVTVATITSTTARTTSAASTTSSATIPPGPGIPGFPVESIVVGLLAGLLMILLIGHREFRRRGPREKRA